MWISKKMLNRDKNNQAIIGEVSASNDNKISILEDVDHKNLSVIVPFGIFYKAPLEEKCVLLTSDNENLCAGIIMQDKSLDAGDLLLSTKSGAGILIKANGDVEIDGNVKINGIVQ